MKIKKISHFTESPIIIGGCGRSGTTLLAAILSSHPQIYSYTHETMAFCPEAWGDPLNRNVPFKLENLFEPLSEYPPTSKQVRFMEKTPKNTIVYERIADSFDGEVKILNLVRDGRDVVLSKYPGKEDEQYVTADFWKTEMKYGMECDSFTWIKTIRYEDLILNFNETLLEICDFCNLEFSESLLNYTDFTKYKYSGAWSHGKVLMPHSNSIGKWKNNLDHPEVEKLNLDPDSIEILKTYKYIINE